MRELRVDASAVVDSRRHVERALTEDLPIYGINTGFGALAEKRIEPARLAELQRNLLLSHACGTGDPLNPDISRLMLRLKIHALALGYSGISEPVFRQLLALDEKGIVPWIPSRGSVGASGDLAPLAHMSLPLIGAGQCWKPDFSGPEPAVAALERTGTKPVELAAKDGLALINGTQLMAACGAFVLSRCIRLVASADILGAMSLEALQGSARPFDERIHRLRPHPGQLKSATNVRRLLERSEILEAHRDCGKVQDPYSLRCIPQVHGASRDALAHASDIVERELNSVTDNPLVSARII